jgi:hypothetical protein
MLNLDQNNLAAAAAVPGGVIIDFEKGRRLPGKNNLAAIRAAIEAAGVVLLEPGQCADGGPGVRLQKYSFNAFHISPNGLHEAASP